MNILKHILSIGLLMLLCICTLKITAHAEPETTAAVTEVTTQAAEATTVASEDTEITHTFEGYIIVLIAALFGCLVALGFWNVLGV